MNLVDGIPIDPFAGHRAVRSSASQETAVSRLRIAYFRRSSDGHLVGTATLDGTTEGPPGYVHGGSIATLLDEVMTAAAAAAGHLVLARSMTVRFQRRILVGTTCTFDAWLEELDRRELRARARLVPGGTIAAEAEGQFVIMTRIG